MFGSAFTTALMRCMKTKRKAKNRSRDLKDVPLDVLLREHLADRFYRSLFLDAIATTGAKVTTSVRQ